MAAFELERFGWAGESRLEVIGRWTGLRGRRAGAAVLSVEVDGRRHRLPALSAGALTDDLWEATFEWDGDPRDVTGAELEVARTLVVALPAPRRRRRPPAADPPAPAAAPETDEVAADAVAPEPDAVATDVKKDAAARDTAAREAADAAAREAAADVAAREQELAGLRLAHGTLRTSHEQLEDEIETLRGVRDERDALSGELERAQAQLADEERGRASLEELVRKLRDRSVELDAELARVREQGEAALAAAHAEATERVETERATVTEVHSRLATAREEAQGTIAAEAEETERLRAELDTARAEAERLLAVERAEVAHLREALAARADEETGDAAGETSARMLERLTRDLERERAASRHLRRELDVLQAESAEQRRADSSATANGTLWTDQQPVAVRAVRTPEGTRRRVSVAREHAAQRVPSLAPAPASLWAVRVLAVAAVVALGIMLFILLSALT
jgi:chromosome segregation ATPase